MFWTGVITGIVGTAIPAFFITTYLVAKAYQLGREDQAKEEDMIDELLHIQKIRQNNNRF